MQVATKRVAFFGEAGSFAHAAAVRRFVGAGRSAELLPGHTVWETRRMMVEHRADFAVVPFENTTGGPIDESLEMFMRPDFGRHGETICELLVYPVVLSLLANCPRSDIRRVYSHPFAAGKAAPWLEEHLPGAKIVEVLSTGTAARKAVKLRRAAAVAGAHAAKLYGLRVLATDLGGLRRGRPNYTIFAVLGNHPSELHNGRGEWRTSLVVRLRHRAGSLYKAINPIGQLGINLTKIMSFPIAEKPSEYRFLLEMAGSTREREVQLAVRKVKAQSLELKLLGSYPFYVLK
ncbi:MAG: hypothetical protein HYY13_13125 [Nitrospirae bacterium]|nr:hypothetical protein [Nitrospirota bacterium]